MAAPTPPTRNAGGRRREREIYRAAVEIFHRKGFSDASVEDIADAVGILKGSLYHYINSKEDLLFGILREVHTEVDELLRAARERTELSPLSRLLDYVHRQVSYNAENVEKIAVYYHDLNQLSRDRLDEITELRHAHERYVRELIAEAQEQGEIEAVLDQRLVAAQVFASMGWLYTWYRRGGSLSAQSIADFTVEFLRRGLVPAAR